MNAVRTPPGWEHAGPEPEAGFLDGGWVHADCEADTLDAPTVELIGSIPFGEGCSRYIELTWRLACPPPCGATATATEQVFDPDPEMYDDLLEVR